MILRTIIDCGILTTNPSTCIVPALQDHHGAEPQKDKRQILSL